MVPPGDFYYVEFETWPGRNTDKWKKLYRLQNGKMILLKQFDFDDDGYGQFSSKWAPTASYCGSIRSKNAAVQ